MKSCLSEKIKSGYLEVDFDDDSVVSRPSFEGENIFTPKSSAFGPQFQMGALLLTGLSLMFAHHSYYSFLNGKPIELSTLEMTSGLRLLATDQSIASVVGNTVAYVARAVLSAAIGVVFVQVLWSRLRRYHYSVTAIDALMTCKGGPFGVSVLPVWRHSFLLAVIASMAVLMALISLVTPGALRVQTVDFSFPLQCSVPTVSLATTNIISASSSADSGPPADWTVQTRILQLVAQVLMNGAPLPPPNPCPFPCQYNISFNAPSAICSPVDSDFDFSTYLPPANSSEPIRVWASTHGQYGSTVTAAMRDLEMNESAVNCTTYNSTYHVTVTHENTSPSTVDILHIEPHGVTYGGGSVTDLVEMQYDSLTTGFGNLLYGAVDLEPNDAGLSFSDNLLVGYSPGFSGRTNHPWDPTMDLGSAISSFMQNISLSVLSDQISREGNSTTAPFDTTCWYTTSSYSYNPVRLFAAYGAAIAVTVLCMLCGLRAVRLNGVEESFSFSRIVGAVLNKSLFEDRYALTEGSKLTGAGSQSGQLRLVRTTYG